MPLGRRLPEPLGAEGGGQRTRVEMGGGAEGGAWRGSRSRGCRAGRENVGEREGGAVAAEGDATAAER